KRASLRNGSGSVGMGPTRPLRPTPRPTRTEERPGARANPRRRTNLLARPRGPSGSRPMAKILLLSFDDALRERQRTALVADGHEVLEGTPTWPACFETAKQEHPDAVVIDLGE